jgi:hypothetical protein
MVFSQIKRKRERKRGRPAKREKNTPSSKKPEIMHSYLFNRHARLNSFSWLQGHKNLRISRTVGFILPFIFSLYDE